MQEQIKKDDNKRNIKFTKLSSALKNNLQRRKIAAQKQEEQEQQQNEE